MPGGPHQARRIEHRVSCGDINPYLALAAILGAALIGVEDGLTPPAPITGNAYDQNLPRLMPNWSQAIDAFETDPMIARIFEPGLIENYVMTKRQEVSRLEAIAPEDRWKVYLEAV